MIPATVEAPRPSVKVPRRGFALRCPLCGAEDALSVRLDDVRKLACDQCGEDFAAEDLRALIGRWTVVLAWLDTAPGR